MKLTFLGTGTSLGVPVIGCSCPTCTSNDPRNRRTRPSALLEIEGKKLCIDIGPDFRQQMLANSVTHLDAILVTHAHADHILGINDITALNVSMAEPACLYMSGQSLYNVRKIFFFAFSTSNGVSSSPDFHVHTFDDEPFEVEGIPVIPLPVLHSNVSVHGFRFGNLAYVTDAKEIPATSIELLKGVDVLVLNSLKYNRSHPAHLNVVEACELIERIGPGQAYLTHIGHDIHHERVSKLLPENVRLAYDGLEVSA